MPSEKHAAHHVSVEHLGYNGHVLIGILGNVGSHEEGNARVEELGHDANLGLELLHLVGRQLLVGQLDGHGEPAAFALAVE